MELPGQQVSARRDVTTTRTRVGGGWVGCNGAARRLLLSVLV